jgi:hypothetical protein
VTLHRNRLAGGLFEINMIVEVSVAVGRDYMLKKPAGPSAPKLFLDTKVVPTVVNFLGSAEVTLDRLSLRTGVRPGVILAGAAAFGTVGIYWLVFGSSAEKTQPMLQELPPLR